MKPFLKINEKIALHLPRPEIAEPLFEVIDQQRKYLREWLPWVDATTNLKDSITYIKEAQEYNKKGERLLTFIYYENEIAGSIGLVNIFRKNKSAEIGYWLREDLQSKGIMTQACIRLINYVFKTKDLNKIILKIATANQKSLAIPQRLGFKKEGTLREELLMYKKFYDLELFGLLKKEWQKQALIKTNTT